MNAVIDFTAVKTRQQTAWASGDYAEIVRSDACEKMVQGYVEELNRVPEETINVLLTVMSEGEINVPRLGRVAADEPSLAEMTRAAITMLEQNDRGYVLMVEGGRIGVGGVMSEAEASPFAALAQLMKGSGDS